LRTEKGSNISSRSVTYELLEQGITKYGSPPLIDKMDKTIAPRPWIRLLETIDLTIAYLTYELSLRPDLQARLRKEVRSLSPHSSYTTSSGHELLPARSIAALPLLDAVIQETLRRYPAAPGPLLRLTA